MWGKHPDCKKCRKTDTSTGFVVPPWNCSCFSLLYHHCSGGIDVFDLTLLNSCAHLDSVRFPYHKDGEAPRQWAGIIYV